MVSGICPRIFGDLNYRLFLCQPRKMSMQIPSSDSSWGIAARPEIYGDGTQWNRLYQANRAVLDAEAAHRGMGSNMGSRLAFAGTVITIPK